MKSSTGFEDTLARLAAQPNVLAALVTSADGLPLAIQLPQNLVDDGEVWAAVSAALGNLAGQLSVALEQGDLKAALFRTERRQFLVRTLPIGFLVVIAESEPPGVEVDLAAQEIAQAAQGLLSAQGK